MNSDENAGPVETCELLLLRAGGQLFAVRAEEADGEPRPCPRPAPRPRAPRAVLGVVALRGRMRTVLDPSALGVENQSEEGAGRDGEVTRGLVVGLRGDEQLALAVESAEGVIRVPATSLAPQQRPARPLRAALEHEGSSLLVVDPAQLFDAAMQGTERRRPRT